MTPAIAEALADLIEAITLSRPIRPYMDRICVAVGLPESAPWPEMVAALRARIANDNHAERVENETDAALVAAVTATHAGDLTAASDAATCAFALLGLDSAFRVRVGRPDAGLPEGWSIGTPATHPDGVVSYPALGPDAAYVMLHVHAGVATWSRVHAAPPAVYLHLLHAAGVAS